MSRAFLFALVVALVVCYASCVPAGKNASCPPGKVWEQCTSLCAGRCPKAIPNIPDPCGLVNCEGGCVCKDGYFLDTQGNCVFEQACED